MDMSLYETLRALHILAVTGWIAGLLLLPRLLVYRLEGAGEAGLEQAMDRAAMRLQKTILTPSMLLSWVFGLSLMVMRFSDSLVPFWMWGKLALVLLLTALHARFTVWRRQIATGKIPVSPKKLRLINELPFILMMIIVFLVVLEPWDPGLRP